MYHQTDQNLLLNLKILNSVKLGQLGIILFESYKDILNGYKYLLAHKLKLYNLKLAKMI